MLTINPLETAAWWRIDIVTVWTVQLHCVVARNIGPSTGNNVYSIAKDAWTRTEYPAFVLVNLCRVCSELQLESNDPDVP